MKLRRKYSFITGQKGFKEFIKYNVSEAEKFVISCDKSPYKVEVTTFGTKYNFNTKLKGNDCKYHSANVTIVVQNDNGKTTWRIITLTPGKKDK